LVVEYGYVHKFAIICKGAASIRGKLRDLNADSASHITPTEEKPESCQEPKQERIGLFNAVH
jgi:hypothetical protein